VVRIHQRAPSFARSFATRLQRKPRRLGAGYRGRRFTDDCGDLPPRALLAFHLAVSVPTSRFCCHCITSDVRQATRAREVSLRSPSRHVNTSIHTHAQRATGRAQPFVDHSLVLATLRLASASPIGPFAPPRSWRGLPSTSSACASLLAQLGRGLLLGDLSSRHCRPLHQGRQACLGLWRLQRLIRLRFPAAGQARCRASRPLYLKRFQYFLAFPWVCSWILEVVLVS
jgi:hypothetical protein